MNNKLETTKTIQLSLCDLDKYEPIPKNSVSKRFKDNSRRRPIKACSSKYMGVYFTTGRWKAQIMIEKKVRSLGYYSNEETAARVYSKATSLYKIKKKEGLYGGLDLRKIPDQQGLVKRQDGSFKGVKLLKKPGRADRYQARLTVNGKIRHLGTFDTPGEAACIYTKALVKLGIEESSPPRKDSGKSGGAKRKVYEDVEQISEEPCKHKAVAPV